MCCPSLCVACGWVKRHLCWVKCDSSCVTQLRAMEAPPCPFLLPKHLRLEQMAWKSPLHSCCHPQPCPTWILRSKTRPISVVSSSPWAKVKGFALRAAENTGLAWELPGVARTLHQCFRSSSYWFSVTKHFRKKVEIVYVWCGSFISVLLSGSFSFFLFFPHSCKARVI